MPASNTAIHETGVSFRGGFEPDLGNQNQENGEGKPNLVRLQPNGRSRRR